MQNCEDEFVIKVVGLKKKKKRMFYLMENELAVVYFSYFDHIHDIVNCEIFYISYLQFNELRQVMSSENAKLCE